jgi:hypothetical protein
MCQPLLLKQLVKKKTPQETEEKLNHWSVNWELYEQDSVCRDSTEPRRVFQINN